MQRLIRARALVGRLAALLLLAACGSGAGGLAGSGPSGNLTWFFSVWSAAETQVCSSPG